MAESPALLSLQPFPHPSLTLPVNFVRLDARVLIFAERASPGLPQDELRSRLHERVVDSVRKQRAAADPAEPEAGSASKRPKGKPLDLGNNTACTFTWIRYWYGGVSTYLPCGGLWRRIWQVAWVSAHTG